MHIAYSKYAPGMKPEIGACYLMPSPLFEELEAGVAATEDDYIPCRWEERFELGSIHAMMAVLEEVTRSISEEEKNRVLANASRLPALFGRFQVTEGSIWFHAEEGEAWGPNQTWVEHANGVRERLW